MTARWIAREPMIIPEFEIQAPFEPSVEGPPPGAAGAHWFVYAGSRLLVEELGKALLPPRVPDPRQLGLEPLRTQYLGRLAGQHCYAAEVAEDSDAPPGMGFQGLRSAWESLPPDLYVLAGRALQIIDWDRKHQYCGRCGTSLVDRGNNDRARECPGCGLVQFPRISPAVMALVRRDERLLLARSPHFPRGFYSVLAGFVDPGETLEACLRREVREEVGLEVDNIEYFASQPWPFPHSLMVAFTCDYAGGEIRVDGEEILEADWYHPGDLPRRPGPISIAGRLIEWFLQQHAGG